MIGEEFHDESDTFVGGLPNQAVTAARNDDQAGSGNETSNELGVLW